VITPLLISVKDKGLQLFCGLLFKSFKPSAASTINLPKIGLSEFK